MLKAFSIDFADFKFLNETAVASGALFLLNLIQVTESISGSVVPLAMFNFHFSINEISSISVEMREAQLLISNSIFKW